MARSGLEGLSDALGGLGSGSEPGVLAPLPENPLDNANPAAEDCVSLRTANRSDQTYHWGCRIRPSKSLTVWDSNTWPTGLQCQLVSNILSGDRFIAVKGKTYGRATRHPTLRVAQHLGTNAVVGVRFATSVLMGGAAELLAYGTAIVVEDE
jgi:hypothetical protein